MKINFSNQSITSGLKISKAQQMTLGIVGLTAVVVGAGLVLMINFFKYISFNNKALTAQAEAISGYSRSIKNSGACKAPKNTDYTQEELKNCDPNEVKTKEVPGTLRASIMDDASSNIGLESVGRKTLSVCINPDTDEPYTSIELKDKYMNSETTNDKRYYMNAIKICSALRVIPDSLPIVKNTEALLASLDQIYLISNWRPSSIAPNSSNNQSNFEGLSSIVVNFNNEEENIALDRVRELLGNVSKSIRFFNVTSLRIEVPRESDNVKFFASAEAYYTGSIESSETTKTITAKEGK